jgi:hypothetical protein
MKPILFCDQFLILALANFMVNASAIRITNPSTTAVEVFIAYVIGKRMEKIKNNPINILSMWLFARSDLLTHNRAEIITKYEKTIYTDSGSLIFRWPQSMYATGIRSKK